MPLTNDGWIDYTREELQAIVVAAFKQYMGDVIDVSPGSPMGKIVAVLTELFYDIQGHMHDSYDSGFVSFATGISLDRKAHNFSVQRRLAQSAQVTLTITGTPGYLIAANTEFDTDNADAFFTGEDVQIDDDGNATVVAYSEDAASYTNVDANTIINQATPVDEIETVNNPASAAGGADLETDYDLRHRLFVNTNSKAGPTISGLTAAVINVTGVTGVMIQNNDDPQKTDKYGNPPMSMHFYVSGGYPQDVAQAIADNIAGGAVTIGAQQFAIDVDGSNVDARFDTAESVNLSFKLSITEGDGYDQDAVNEAVAEFLDEFDMGETVVLNKLYSYLYSLSGIDEVTGIQASVDGTTFTSDNIQLEKYQIAKSSDELIEVTANA